MNKTHCIFLFILLFVTGSASAQNITADELLEFFWLPQKDIIENGVEENEFNLETRAVILWHDDYEYIAAYFWIVHDKGGRWMPMVLEAGFEDWMEVEEVVIRIHDEVFHFNDKKGNYRWKKEGRHSLGSSFAADSTVYVISVFCELNPDILEKIMSADKVNISLHTKSSVIELVLYRQERWQKLLPRIQRLH
jgi:hypothetical protein